MKPTISALRGWDPSTVSGAGEAAQAAAKSIDGALDAVVRAMDGASSWFGATHNAAQLKVTQERDHASEVRNVLNAIADEAKDAGADFTYAREYVLREVDAAVAGGFTVSETGVVTHTDHKKDNDAKTYQTAIQGGLTTIADYDERYGTKLAELRGDLAGMVNGQPDITLPNGTTADPDDLVQRLKHMSPDERRDFLSRLSAADRRHLLQADPETMGNLDGVSFEDRATANEINIRNALADEQQAGRGHGPRAEQLTAMLTAIPDPANQDTSDPKLAEGSGADDHLMERKYIAFSTDGNGHIIEMIGSLSPNSKGAGVYVPGTGTNLDGIEANHRAAWNLARESGSPIFLYADGDFPQSFAGEDDGLAGAKIGALAGTPGGPLNVLGGAVLGGLGGEVKGWDTSASSGALAQQMAPRLVGFGHELDSEIAEHAPGLKTTYIGHSYGGSVVGTAEQLGLNADRVIYASSAGTGAEDGPWHNPNPNVERYSLTAPGDIIQNVQGIPGGPHGADPDHVPGVTRLDTGTYGGDVQHANPGTPHKPGEVIQGASGHGDYWNDPSSTAFQNMAAVISGGEPTPYVDRGPDSAADAADEWTEEHRDDILRMGAGAALTAGGFPLLGLPLIAGDLPLNLK